MTSWEPVGVDELGRCFFCCCWFLFFGGVFLGIVKNAHNYMLYVHYKVICFFFVGALEKLPSSYSYMGILSELNQLKIPIPQPV